MLDRLYVQLLIWTALEFKLPGKLLSIARRRAKELLFREQGDMKQKTIKRGGMTTTKRSSRQSIIFLRISIKILELTDVLYCCD